MEPKKPDPRDGNYFVCQSVDKIELSSRAWHSFIICTLNRIILYMFIFIECESSKILPISSVLIYIKNPHHINKLNYSLNFLWGPSILQSHNLNCLCAHDSQHSRASQRTRTAPHLRVVPINRDRPNLSKYMCIYYNYIDHTFAEADARALQECCCGPFNEQLLRTNQYSFYFN